MSSQIRVGDIYREATKVKWTIKDFEGELTRAGQSIRSPRFSLRDSVQNLRSFHLEMEIPNKTPGTRCPLNLIREDEAGQIATTNPLEEYPPLKSTGLKDTLTRSESQMEIVRVFKVTLESCPFVMTSSTIKMPVTAITLIGSDSPFNQIVNDVIIMLQVEQSV
jgi:hypothetical protein